MRTGPTDEQQCQVVREKMDEEGPEPDKRHRDFSFLGDFETGKQSAGSLSSLHLHFALERASRTEVETICTGS